MKAFNSIWLSGLSPHPHYQCSNEQDKKSTLEASTVVLATGLKSEQGLEEALKKEVPEVYATGDCVRPRKVINAIWEAFRAALFL